MLEEIPLSDRQEVRLIVIASLRGLRDGEITVQKASAIFAGAKIFLMLEDPEPLPNSGKIPVHKEAVRLLEVLADAPGSFTFQQIVDICREHKIFEALMLGKQEAEGFRLTPAACSKFGRLLSKFAPHEEAETYTVRAAEYQFYSTGTCRHKRYIFEKI
jgi:hypothetical protein